MCMELITAIKDLVVTGAALIGAVVAVKGLGTWQRQLKGKSEYELSRRILVSLFKYRDAINGVRHPMMWANEMPSPPEEEAKKMSSEQIRFYGSEKAYIARWDKAQTERSALYADLLEAEAIWGTELKDRFKAIFDLEHELLVAIRHYLQQINPDEDEATKEAIGNIDSKRRDIMYDDLSEEGDEYKKEFASAVQNVEQYLKPKLQHGKV